MSDEGPEEMERDLKEYLACFKTDNTDTRNQPNPRPNHRSTLKTTRPEMHKNKGALNSSEEDSLSENSSLFGTSPPHKKFNLQDINDLQASQTLSESGTISPNTLQGDKGDDNSNSGAVGKLVLSLKELGSTSEDATSNSNNGDMEDNITTSSFNINENVFTVDDLLVASDVNTASKSTADVSVVTDKAVDDRELKSYKDDFEEEENESMIVEESFASSESIKEFVSSSDAMETHHSKSSRITQSTNTTISLSPDGGKDSSIGRTEGTQPFSTSQDRITSTESSLSKHEVAVQTDPSWKVPSQQGALNSIFLLGDSPIQRSEGEIMTLHNLVAQQLQLTRSLINTARSLHHSQTVAICPDYHYVTLEDTKQFIETHKPKMLKMKKK